MPPSPLPPPAYFTVNWPHKCNFFLAGRCCPAHAGTMSLQSRDPLSDPAGQVMSLSTPQKYRQQFLMCRPCITWFLSSCVSHPTPFIIWLLCSYAGPCTTVKTLLFCRNLVSLFMCHPPAHSVYNLVTMSLCWPLTPVKTLLCCRNLVSLFLCPPPTPHSLYNLVSLSLCWPLHSR